MIAVLMGGNSAERQVSLDGGQAVYQSIKSQQLDCFKFDWCGNNLDELWGKKFDTAFIMLHGRGGEDGYIQQQLEQRQIAYTGSGSKSSEKCMNKNTTKQVWAKHNLPIPAWIVAQMGDNLEPINFPLPWAIKPILEGSSVGISKVEKPSDLDEALKLAWKYDKQALIEQWISGGEYTVAILNGKALPVIQIKTGNNFYDYKSKYLSNSTQYLCPCNLSAAKQKQLQEIAMQAFTVMGAKVWGRVDFMLDANNTPYLLEINTVPGMTKHSLVPMAAKAAGLSFEQLTAAILKQKTANPQKSK